MGVLWVCTIAVCMVVCAGADRGGSSLRGALEALQRRQRGRMHGPLAPDYDALYEFIPPQGYPEPDFGVDVLDVDDEQTPRYVVQLLDQDERPSETYEYKIIKKKKSTDPNIVGRQKESAFRERSHHSDNDRLKDLFMDKNEAETGNEIMLNKAENDAQYALLLEQLWSKYKNNKARNNGLMSEPQGVVKMYKDKVVKKRYPNNWGPIAFKRKRSSGSENDRPNIDFESEKANEAETAPNNYNAYQLADEDKDDMREEYAIAFQPLDDDNISGLSDDDRYSYNTPEQRFAVRKRSGGPYNFGNTKKRFANIKNKPGKTKSFRSSSGTDPRIIKDLSQIFGSSEAEIVKSPVKRSSDIQSEVHETKPPLAIKHENNTHDHSSTKNNDDSHEQHGFNLHHPGISGNEKEHVHDHSHDHHPNEKPLIVRKKSIDWSDYFGIDKRSKKSSLPSSDIYQDKLRKQYLDTFNKEVIYPNSFRSHSYVKRNYVQPNENDDSDVQIDHTRGAAIEVEKRSTEFETNSKLDDIDKNLRNMEGQIVDDALHYSETTDKLDSKEEQEMKEQLLSKLAAAYSLEKMRKALKEFKQTLKPQKHSPEVQPSPVLTEESKEKRVAIKKEKAEISNNEIPSNNKVVEIADFEDEQGAGHYLNGKIEHGYSEGYMGGSGRHRTPILTPDIASGACPVLAKIVQRCRSVDMLAGDHGQLFLPLCSLHQICYLCGEAPQTTCDLVFVSEADSLCESDMLCQRSARSALMALRELHDNLADELDGECEASPCLPATLKLNTDWQRALQ